MQNVETRVEGNKLIVTIDLNKRYGASDSGKTIRVASTEGNVTIDGAPDLKIGLNVYTGNPDYTKGKKGAKKQP